MSSVTNFVDAALEWSVLGSFTRVGPALRRRLDHWAPLEGQRLARNAAQAEATCAGLRQETGKPKVGFLVADTGDLAAERVVVHAMHPGLGGREERPGALMEAGDAARGLW